MKKIIENELSNILICFKESMKLTFSTPSLILCSFLSVIILLVSKDFLSAFYSFLIGSAISVPYVLKNKKIIFNQTSKLKGKTKSFISKLKDGLSLSKSKNNTFRKENEDSKVDNFISIINSKIKYLAQIRYPGFEQEVNDLYSLAISYLDAKKDLNIINGKYVLMGNKIFLDKLNEIEERIKNNEKMREDQDINRQAIAETLSSLNDEIPLSLDQASILTPIEESPIKLDTEPFRVRRK